MTIICVQNVSLADIEAEAGTSGKTVAQTGLQYATKERLAASLGIDTNDLILTDDDFSTDGWIRQDAQFEINISDGTALASLINTSQIKTDKTFSAQDIKKLQSLKSDESAYVFYDKTTGKRKCEVTPLYHATDATDSSIEISAAQISIYAPETGSLLYVGAPDDPYSFGKYGDFADYYCKTNTFGFVPENQTEVISRMESRGAKKNSETAVATR